MALLVLALVAIAAAFMIYRAIGNASKRDDLSIITTASFGKIDEALLQFAMLYKRLPCPASGTLHTGDEDPATTITNLVTGTTTCNSPSGVVPWKVLGLEQSAVLDPSGRYISYRVYDGTSGFTRTGGLDVVNCQNDDVLTGYPTGSCATTRENTLRDFVSGKGVTVNDMGTAKSSVAYVLISTGETGFGAYYPGGSAPNTMPSSSSKEFQNAGSGGTYWITAASSPETAASDATHFDDVVSYKFAYDLANALKLARPWALQVTLDGSAACSPPTGATCTSVSPLLNVYLQNPLKMSTNSGNDKGAVTVTAAADVARFVCKETGGSTNAMSACLLTPDELTTSGNEKLTFDFKVRRAVAMIKLLGMQHTGGGDEQAQFTFYNNGTQVAQVTKISCNTGGNALGQYTISMPSGTEFTSVEVKALNKTNGGSSSISVAAIAACYPLGATCQVPSYNAADDCP